jgi:hypothetical protein
MTLGEKLAIAMKSIELEKQGKADESMRIFKRIPLPPYLARSLKKTMGADYLLKSGWNLSEADAEYGIDWLGR